MAVTPRPRYHGLKKTPEHIVFPAILCGAGRFNIAVASLLCATGIQGIRWIMLFARWYIWNALFGLSRTFHTLDMFMF